MKMDLERVSPLMKIEDRDTRMDEIPGVPNKGI